MHTLLKQAVRENFAEKVSYIARSLPGMTVVEDDALLSVDCGLPSDTFNVIVVRDAAAADPLLKQHVARFMTQRLPMALWCWEDAADQLDIAAVTGYKLPHTETHVAMYAERPRAPSHAIAPTGLTISLVEQPHQLQQYGAVIAALFGDSDEARYVAAYFDRLSAYPLSSVPAMRFYLGLYDGEAVATGTLFVGSDTLGIYDIVTRAEYRHKGIGSAMFAHLLWASTAYEQRYVVLQASPDGLSIYLKAGFTSVGQVHTFENRTLL